MFWFGDIMTDELWIEESAWTSIGTKQKKLFETPLEEIINLLDQFSKEWINGSADFEEISSNMPGNKDELRSTISILAQLLSRESLEKRISGEFTEKKVLDKFSKMPYGSAKVRAIPRGPTLHITAGNVFLSSLDSLIMGLITKNVSLLKVSHQNKFFPLHFAKKIFEFDKKKILSDKFAIVYWKGGDKKVEDLVKKRVKTIIAWGGEEMVESYRQNLPAGVKFLDFGPKVSIQVMSMNGLKNRDLKNIANKIVGEVIIWNQQACASPQNLYLQEGIETKKLMLELSHAFSSAVKRGQIDEDEAVEILKEEYRALYSKLMEDGGAEVGKDYLLHFEKNSYLRPSPLNRSLILKTYKDANDLYDHLAPFSAYLQSCSYLFGDDEKNEYLDQLAAAGIKRFAPLGSLMMGMDGAPHDGRFVLRELVSFVGDEFRIQNYGEKNREIHDSKSLKKNFEKSPHPRGYIFSSGGTTGDPKFVHYSYEEFDYVTDMIAKNFTAQGVTAGMTVANLFVAGNLWSSFIAVEKALEKIGVVQLPIGGQCAIENIVMYLEKFRPDVVIGIPSLLISVAERSGNLKIENVFYAGEALSQVRRRYLQETWNVKYFGSAGYASVDAGIIGYQCRDCEAGVHHLFSDQVELQIIDDEAVITSGYRTSLEIKNYRTGDRAELIDGVCACGSLDPRFKLLGRIDNIIQVWSCRLNLNDIEKALQDLNSDVVTYQIILSHESQREIMTIKYESSDIDSMILARSIYENSRDLKDTISFEQFVQNFKVEKGEVARNSRTGKIKVISDLRV